MPSLDPNRRAFLTACIRKSRVLAVSCERLYIRHMEARREGRLQEFLAALTAEVDAADQLLVTEDNWLDREAFRSDVEPILRRRRSKLLVPVAYLLAEEARLGLAGAPLRRFVRRLFRRPAIEGRP